MFSNLGYWDLVCFWCSTLFSCSFFFSSYRYPHEVFSFSKICLYALLLCLTLTSVLGLPLVVQSKCTMQNENEESFDNTYIYTSRISKVLQQKVKQSTDAPWDIEPMLLFRTYTLKADLHSTARIIPGCISSM